MSLPERMYFSIPQLAERWKVQQHQVLDHVVTGSLQPSIFVDDVECVRSQDGKPSEILRISGEIQFIPSMTLLTHEKFWLSGGSYRGNCVWLDLSEPEFKLPAGVLFMKAMEISVSDIRIRYAPYVKLYEEEILNKKPSENNTYIRNLERTIVALTHALKHEKPKFKYGESPNLTQISEFAVAHLSDGNDNFPTGWTPSSIKKTLEAATKNVPLPE